MIPRGYVQIYTDPVSVIHRLGNHTSTGTSEILVSTRAYSEQSSEAQRSVVSTSSQDDDSGGTGAKQVRITYLNSSYILKTEDITMAGTTAVNTTGTDIRFIERFEVIKGAACVGAVKIMTATNGGGSEFCGMGAGTNETFLCHHYIPAGMIATLVNWGATTDLNANFKLKGQKYFGSNLVDQIVALENLTGPGIVTAGRSDFDRGPHALIQFGEKTRVHVTVVPGVSGLITRARLDLREVPL